MSFISEIFDEKFQPSEVDYVEMSDEKIIEQAIKAGISREIAKESLNGQYDEWIEKSNDYTILRSDLIAPGREGFATPFLTVNKRIWSMKDMALDDLSDAFVESLGLKPEEVGDEDVKPRIGSKGKLLKTNTKYLAEKSDA